MQLILHQLLHRYSSIPLAVCEHCAFLHLGKSGILHLIPAPAPLLICACCLGENIKLQSHILATPEPGSTWLADPNQNPGTLNLLLFIFHVIKFSFSKMSRPKFQARPEWRIQAGASLLHIFIYLIKTFYYVISLQKRFQFWARP